MADIGRATQKWAQRSAAASGDYRTGVQGKGSKWLSNTVGAQNLWQQRIQEAATSGSWQAGVQSAGAGGWEQAAASKGAQNYGPGVSNPLSQQKYSQNFGPVLSAINGAVSGLGPRGAPMSAENMARAQAIWQAAHSASQSRKGGSYSTTSYGY